METTIQRTETLNSLLRGELAATETYQQAMNVLSNAAGVTDLQRIHEEHREAANTLRLQIREAGGEPEHSSGAWGAWAGAVTGTAKTFGPRMAAEALMKGEQYGVKDYEQALQDDSLPGECKTLIHNQLLPHTREHVATLERIVELL